MNEGAPKGEESNQRKLIWETSPFWSFKERFMVVESVLTQWEKRGRNGQGCVSPVGRAYGVMAGEGWFSTTRAVSCDSDWSYTLCPVLFLHGCSSPR